MSEQTVTACVRFLESMVGRAGRAGMGKRQTRRSVSMRGKLYDVLKVHCDRHGVAIAAVVEGLVSEHLASCGVEVPRVEPTDATDRDPARRMAKPERPRTVRSDLPVLHRETGGVLRPAPSLARALAAFNEERGYIREEPRPVDDGPTPAADLEFQR
jgi:hypothetical protein